LEIKERRRKPYVILLVVVAVCGVLLSAIWRVPYLDTLMSFAAVTLVVDLITADEDLPGGLRNPDGKGPLPWRGVAIKAAVLAGLVGCAIVFPTLRTLGG
jgi:hypothetical protein